MLFIRQILFNILFYSFTAVLCVVLLPFTLLPRRRYIFFLTLYFKFVHVLEKYVLGLDFVVRGAENIPASGAFIVAAKHYSAYETMKPHVLFHDPAIIMKNELKYIPIWGWLAVKARMIFINRRAGSTALKSIIEGAKRIKREGRPLVIFPQGTRVGVEDTPLTKPYKGGVIRVYEAAELPILPLAMNSTLFWKKKAFFKYPGKVIFEFLPVIPAGLKGSEAMERLKDALETNSNRLIAEELENRRKAKSNA